MDHMETYRYWLKQKSLDKAMKEELERMDEPAIKEAFYRDLSFGTGGLRGIMGPGTNRINRFTIRRATAGFADYILENGYEGCVPISYDNRTNSQAFAREAAMVLAAKGIDAYVFAELRPTPMLSYAVRYLSAAGGIMITASHNPKAYNGFKVYNRTGAQISLKEAAAITDSIEKIDDPFGIAVADNERIHAIGDDLEKNYFQRVQSISLNEVEKDAKIVYSPLHGTGGPVIPKLLESSGYLVHPYEPHMPADPDFTNTDSANPEDAIAFEKPIAYAEKIGADLIMLTDPDADRLGIAVRHDDRYVLLNGNETVSIMLDYLLEQRKRKGELTLPARVYQTIVTTDLIERIAASHGVTVIRTLTGFKFIGERIEADEGKAEYIFGCEESYGSLIAPFVRDKDAVQAVYLLAEIVNYYKADNKTLLDQLEEIHERFGYHREETISLTYQGIAGSKRIERIMHYFRDNLPDIQGIELIGYEDYQKGVRHLEGKEERIDLPSANVLKYYYRGDTWVVLRPSGTEPKLKVYFATRKKTKEDARITIQRLKQVIINIIESLGEKQS
ncbi:MAG: phospho-sugar mutase [Acholeplasmataceae bacterium]